MEPLIAQTPRPATPRLGRSLVFSLLSLLLYFSGIFVWLTPLPTIYLYKRVGRLGAVLSAALALAGLAVLLFLLIPQVEARWGWETTAKAFFWVPGVSSDLGGVQNFPAAFSLFYFGVFTLMGILLGEWEGVAYGATRLVGQVLAITLLVLVFGLLWQIGEPWREFIAGIEAYLVAAMNAVAESAAGNEEMQSQWQMLRPHFAEIAYYAVRLLPAMVVNTLLFVIWLNIVVARRFFTQAPFFSGLGALRQWRLSFAGVWLVIASGLMLAVHAYWLQSEVLKFVAINALTVFALLYFFQGLAIVVFYVLRWSLSPMVRMLLYAVLLLAFQPVGVLLMVCGFFDSWFDFRKLTPKPAAQ